MYQFGQFLSSQKDWTEYKTDIDMSNLIFDYTITQMEEEYFEGNQIKFANFSMRYNESRVFLQNLHYYYLNFKIKKRNDENSNQQVFRLKLQRVENDIVVKEQFIKLFKVPNAPLQEDEDKNYISFEIIISPNSSYNQIIWQMQREYVDYITKETIDGETYDGRVAIIQVNTFSQIVNIINSLQINSQDIALSKVGIQGPPSLLMCINGEQIRIGKNGIYEINNSIQITFLGFIPKSASDYFSYVDLVNLLNYRENALLIINTLEDEKFGIFLDEKILFDKNNQFISEGKNIILFSFRNKNMIKYIGDNSGIKIKK